MQSVVEMHLKAELQWLLEKEHVQVKDVETVWLQARISRRDNQIPKTLNSKTENKDPSAGKVITAKSIVCWSFSDLRV